LLAVALLLEAVEHRRDALIRLPRREEDALAVQLELLLALHEVLQTRELSTQDEAVLVHVGDRAAHRERAEPERDDRAVCEDAKRPHEAFVAEFSAEVES
jgi:hypothetical protein